MGEPGIPDVYKLSSRNQEQKRRKMLEMRNVGNEKSWGKEL